VAFLRAAWPIVRPGPRVRNGEWALRRRPFSNYPKPPLTLPNLSFNEYGLVVGSGMKVANGIYDIFSLT
jgi:hypothetical protein